MVDFLSPMERSERMSRIRSQNTTPELAVRRLLHAAGFRFRLHAAHLVGRPDIVLPRYKSVVFVHGCFWHRHARCAVASNPKSNRAFWQEKFEANVRRDRRNRAKLRRLGWHVFVVWECQVSTTGRSIGTIERLVARLRATVDLQRPKAVAVAKK